MSLLVTNLLAPFPHQLFHSVRISESLKQKLFQEEEQRRRRREDVEAAR